MMTKAELSHRDITMFFYIAEKHDIKCFILFTRTVTPDFTLLYHEIFILHYGPVCVRAHACVSIYIYI